MQLQLDLFETNALVSNDISNNPIRPLSTLRNQLHALKQLAATNTPLNKAVPPLDMTHTCVPIFVTHPYILADDTGWAFFRGNIDWAKTGRSSSHVLHTTEPITGDLSKQHLLVTDVSKENAMASPSGRIPVLWSSWSLRRGGRSLPIGITTSVRSSRWCAC